MARNPADKRFSRLDFDHSRKMLRMFDEIFGLQKFRVNQLEAINATILGKNVFVVGVNGAGKSLCYQLPACLSDGVTVVISPSISLIQDQIQELTELGIKARTLSGDKGKRNAKRIYKQLSMENPKIKLLYVTPEKMTKSRPLTKALQDLFANGLLARFVIDEAHCISQWGDHFRPDYGRLNELQKNFPGVPIIAVSGPVAPHIQVDILKKLQMTKPQVFHMMFFKTNLKYAVRTKTQDVAKDCYTWIKKHYPLDSGIVYCWRRKDCVSMAKSLKEAGLKARSYHAKMTDEDRESVQNKWNENKCLVICATVAFSMGINKPDVRYVIHSFLPKSMEQYLWQTGRAGRDGEISHCILFYSNCDKNQLRYVISNNKLKEESRDSELENLNTMVKYILNTKDCRKMQLLCYFWMDTKAKCDNCMVNQ